MMMSEMLGRPLHCRKRKMMIFILCLWWRMMRDTGQTIILHEKILKRNDDEGRRMIMIELMFNNSPCTG